MPDIGLAPSIYAARPRLEVDGSDQPELGELVLGLVVEETVGGMSRSETTLTNWGQKSGTVGYLHFDRDLLEFGKSYAIEMGAGESSDEVFDGRITGLEGRFIREREPEILVLAEDRLQDLRMTRRTRIFEDVSDADVIQQIGSQHGLQATVDASGPTYRVLAQVNQSDLAFLQERARAVDSELWVDGTELKVVPRSQRNTGDVTLTFGEGLQEFSVLADLAGQASGFTVSGWDVAGKESISHRAESGALSGELNGDLSGGSLLEQALGGREQSVVHRIPSNLEEAQALAEAHFRRTARRFVTGMGVAEGDGRVRVGTHLDLQNLGPLFDGTYYVTHVKHIFDLMNGYRTFFTVERPGIGE